jgi:hypothetical protein
MGREPALEFSLEKDETMSSGFLKLFVTTQHVNLQWIRQTSIFDAHFQGPGAQRSLWNHKELERDLYRWDTLRVIVTMTE